MVKNRLSVNMGPTPKLSVRRSIARKPRNSKDILIRVFTTKKRGSVLRDKLVNYLVAKGTPNWYRGLSKFQIEAANRMHNDLRDDSGQNSTHRVRADLCTLGLTPLYPTDDQLKTLMVMSRANDIAFLWFLWEWFYKSNNGTIFTTNEQILLSAISTLDIIPTLRELDRILPPPQLPKKTILRRQQMEERKRLKELERQEQLKAAAQSKKDSKILPYFQKLPVPRPYGKSLNIDRPDFEVDFGQYNRYKDPEHIEPNELNRWFADYGLDPNMRVIKRVLNKDIIDNVMSAVDITRPMLESSLRSILNKKWIQCNYHQQEDEKYRLKRMAQLVKRREDCLKILDTDRYKRERRRERILKELEESIDKFVQKYRKKLANSCRDCVAELLSETFVCAIHLVDDRCSDVKSEHCEIEDEQSVSLMSGDFLIEKYDSTQQIQYEHRDPGMQDMDDDRCISTSSTSNDYPKGGGYCNQYRHSKKDPICYTKHLCYITDEEMFNYGHAETVTPSPSQCFFEATKEHVPFHFNYGRVFCFKNESGSSMNIKKYAVQALGGTVEDCKAEQDSPPKVDKAIDEYAKKTFKIGAAIKRKEMIMEERRREIQKSIGDDGRLKFDQDYFDPDDPKLMQSMLQRAFCHMSKNPRFVLAGLPEAYKLPLMIEWMKTRYGKRYTHSEKLKLFQFSLKMFNILDKLVGDRMISPPARDLGSNMFVSYKCRNYLLRKFKHIKSKFYRQCQAMIMEHSRIYWFLMQPYLGSIERARPPYFAYMPPRIGNIVMFRPWKSNEYTDMKLIRSERRRHALQTGQRYD